MQLFKQYLLSNVYRSPDDPAAAEPDPAAVDPAASADPAAGDPPEPVAAEPAAKPQLQTVPLKVMLERVGEETSKRQAFERKAAEAEQRAAAAEDLARRLQAAKPGDPAPAAPRQPAPAIDSNAVRQEAEQLVFAQNAQRVSDNGQSAYGAKWNDAVATLNAVGANSSEFVGSVMEIAEGRAHEIMFNIAQDAEKAASLAKMSLSRRIAEITRMVDMVTKAADPKPADPKPADPKPADPKPDAKPAQISRAPAPKPVLQPQGAAADVDPTTPEGDAKLEDKDWEKWYKDKYYKKSA